MKKISLAVFAAIIYSVSWTQYNSPWTYTSPNTSSAGYVGIGTKSTNTTTNTPAPNFNLHLHGTSDYSIYVINPFPQPPSMQNLGKTARIGLTNSTTGMTESDGAVIRMSDNNLLIENREVGEFQLAAGSNLLTFSSMNHRTWFGSNYGTGAEFAKFNISGGSDNGLYLRVPSGKYGLSIRSGSLNDNAIQVVGTNATDERFAVKSSGATTIFYNIATNSDKVFMVKNASQTLFQLTNDGVIRGRGMKLDAMTWADYVFEDDYQLRSLSEVKEYIDQNGHLPEVPSTAEVTRNGVDIAEMNTILLKKVEELTLYLLEQDAKIKDLEHSIETLIKK